MNQRVCKVTQLAEEEMLNLIFKPFASDCERRDGRRARVPRPGWFNGIARIPPFYSKATNMISSQKVGYSGDGNNKRE